MLAAFGIALLLQMAFAFAATRQWLAAAFLAQAALLALAALCARSGLTLEWPSRRRLALIVTVVVLSAGVLTYQIPTFLARAAARDRAEGNQRGSSNEKADRGILLRPKVQRIKIVPPQLHVLREEQSFVVQKKDELIPFTGVYWIFQPPDFTLPPHSPVHTGSPDEFKFHSTDGSEVRLEAHQIFDPPLPLRGVGDIQVELRNVDEQPTSFQLRLTLRDSRLGPAAFVSYSSRYLSGSGNTVRFPKQSTSVITHFDQLTLRFESDPYRWARVPRIGIVGFRFRN